MTRLMVENAGAANEKAYDICYALIATFALLDFMWKFVNRAKGQKPRSTDIHTHCTAAKMPILPNRKLDMN